MPRGSGSGDKTTEDRAPRFTRVVRNVSSFVSPVKITFGPTTTSSSVVTWSAMKALSLTITRFLSQAPAATTA
jgi:hypothetical protein